MFILNLCSSSGPLHLFYIIKVFFKILCIIIPLLIIFRFFSSMFKVIISGKEIGEELTKVVKATVAALIIFLLPSVFNFVFVGLLQMDDVEIVKCFNDATLEKIELLKEKEELEASEALKKENLEKADELNRLREIEQKKNEEKKKFYLEIKKKKEEEAANNNGNGSPNSSSGNLSQADVNIFIGDSRTVGMCIAVTGDSSGCSYSNGGAKYNGSDIFIAQGSMSYSWFNSTAVPAVNAILNEAGDIRFNIYSLMGVNMLLYDIDKYIPSYNSLASGSWSKHNLILVSVNPVDESKEASNGYSTKNSDIVTFNSKLKAGVSGNNVKYCDTYNSILNNMNTSDGIHYSSSTYNSIYSKILSCR